MANRSASFMGSMVLAGGALHANKAVRSVKAAFTRNRHFMALFTAAVRELRTAANTAAFLHDQKIVNLL
jgi:hypothetical protein